MLQHSNRYLHHMPDLLWLAAVYQLVEGQQPLGVRPPGEQRYLKGKTLILTRSTLHILLPVLLTQSSISWGGFSLSGISCLPCTLRLGPGLCITVQVGTSVPMRVVADGGSG